MEALEQSIEAYELQLKQVSDALLATGGDASQNDDLISSSYYLWLFDALKLKNSWVEDKELQKLNSLFL